MQERGILRLLSAPARYIKCKINSIYKKLMKKEPKAPNILENEETLKRKSIDELKKNAKLREIKNRSKLKKDGLIANLLKSESGMLNVIILMLVIMLMLVIILMMITILMMILMMVNKRY